MSGDYSQIELRVLAHLSRDEVLIDAFNSNQDIHTRTAMEIFEVDEEDVDAELRRRAKAVNFGVIYGQGDSGLAKSLGIGRAEASSFIAAYFRRYRGVRSFMDETLEHARAGGSVRTILGRRRLVPDLHSANRAKRFAAERIVMNTPIQGSAADLLKLAMLALSEPVTPGARMILTVHDELVFEVPKNEVAEACARVGVGMFLGSLLWAAFKIERRGLLYVAGSFAGMVFLVCFAAIPWYPSALLFVILAGMAASAFGTMQGVLTMAASPPEMRGRAMGALGMAIGTLPFGMVVLGLLAESVGPAIAVVASVAVGFVVLGAFVARFPAVARLR